MWISGIMTDRISLNIELFRGVIASKIRADLSSVVADRIFEYVDHNYDDFLNGVNYLDNQIDQQINTLNSIVDEIVLQKKYKTHNIAFSMVASRLYTLMLNDVVLPTNFNVGTKIKLVRFKVSLRDDYLFDKVGVLTFLSFIGIVLDQESISTEDIFQHILGYSDVVVVAEIASVEVYSKKILLDEAGEKHDILSLVKQLAFNKANNELLLHKEKNEDVFLDLKKLNSFQSFMLEQQTRFHLYRMFEPALSKGFIKIQDNPQLLNLDGGLFFYLVVGKTKNDPNLFDAASIAELVLNYGFFLSWVDIADHLLLNNANNDLSDEKTKIEVNPHYEDSIYTVLLRLVDSNLKSAVSQIEDMISNKKYSELENFLIDLLSSSAQCEN